MTTQAKHSRISKGQWTVYPIHGNSPESEHVQVSTPETCQWGCIAQVWGKGNARLIASAPQLLEALQHITHEADDLFKLAEDAIIHDGDSWSCRACGMELDTGKGHRDNCCASAILDFGKAIHFAEETLARAAIQSATQSGKGEV